ncbi:MAG TPA: PilZ domain-containing protein [Planctomycetota bacterium]|nr:PilZ domain-containing protein [Planctomycetota bacterium]
MSTATLSSSGLAATKKIGEVLVEMGCLTREQVEDAVYFARTSGEKLGRYLLRKELISPDALCWALAEQFGLPPADLYQVKHDPKASADFPLELMREHGIYPFAATSSVLRIAVSLPLSPSAMQAVKAFCSKEIELYIVQEDLLTQRLDQIFHERGPRRFPRFGAILPVQYQFCNRMGAPLETSTQLVRTMNISEGGIAVCGAPALSDQLARMPRHDIFAHVSLKGSGQEVRAMGQLRWVRSSTKAETGVTLGFEFIEMSSTCRKRMQDLCARFRDGGAAKSRDTAIEIPPPASAEPAVAEKKAEAGGAVQLKTQRFVRTETLETAELPALTPEDIRLQLRALGIVEEVQIHTADYDQFVQERGIQELGRGGEGAVYFLRGHVVKVAGRAFSAAALREIIHMLYLNPLQKGGAIGERERQDLPALLWIYVLSNGALAIGMRPFDSSEQQGGMPLNVRLKSGALVRRPQALKIIRSIASTLAYMHERGVYHHDLKPANIFLPADDERPPVVFDFGQSLWKKSSWGREWLSQPYNLPYCFNGTYRYMHAQRRFAHSAALALIQKRPMTPRQSRAIETHIPGAYDDVYAFGQILREFNRSPRVLLNSADKAALAGVYRSLMGLRPPQTSAPREMEETRFRKLTAMFRKPEKEPVAPADQKWKSMEPVAERVNLIIEARLQSPV